MRTSGAAQVVIALSLVVLALGPFVVGPVAQGPLLVGNDPDVVEQNRVQKPSAFELLDHESPVVRDRPVDTVDSEVRVVARLHENVDLSRRVEGQYSKVYTREGARQLRGRVRLSEVRSLSNEPGVGAVEIRNLPDVEDESVSIGVETIGADELHEKGITGKGVTVGVIDSGFQLTHPEIAGHVSAYQSFDGANGGAHGTAVASVVADTAPDAELHLAAVGPTTTPAEYREAVRWLERSGVDVIVDAGSYFGRPGDTAGGIPDVAANASDDVVFVTSAGNYGRRHWERTVGNESGRIEFAPGSKKNYLNDGDPVAGRVGISLQWSGRADFDLYLVREMPTGDIVVAKSTASRVGPGVATERISQRVSEGRYYVAVRANGSGEGPTDLEMFASHELSHRMATGSLTAPATADRVITVGAYANGSVEPFSSRGVPGKEDSGVDFVAPNTLRVDGGRRAGGTSFAAPYVAGTAALVKSEDPSLSPDGIESMLAMGARDVGPEGVDAASGHGLVDAVRAYQMSHSTTLPDLMNRSTGVGGAKSASQDDQSATQREERVDRNTVVSRTVGGDTTVIQDPLLAWGGVRTDDEDDE